MRLGKQISRALRGLALCSALVLTACGGGGTSGTGTVNLSMTDAPACGYSDVTVTVTKIGINQNANATDSSSGWQYLTLSTPTPVKLLDLQNGISKQLGSISVPSGTYNKMRLILASNGNSAPYSNYIVLSGSSTQTPLNTPSAQQSGTKINIKSTVGTGGVSDLLIDFNACKSVVKAGNSGNYNLKPVLTAIANLTTGVKGKINTATLPDLTVAGNMVSVSLQDSTGKVIRATSPDTSSGVFQLSPVAAGTYNLVISATGKDTVVIKDVQVTSSGITDLNSATDNTINLTNATATAKISGTLTNTTLNATSDATALQTLSGADKIEVNYATVGMSGGNTATNTPDSGTYSFTLPKDAVKVAPYTSTGTFSYNDDATTTSKYQVTATSDPAASGTTSQTSSVIDISTGDQTQNFTFN